MEKKEREKGDEVERGRGEMEEREKERGKTVFLPSYSRGESQHPRNLPLKLPLTPYQDPIPPA